MVMPYYVVRVDNYRSGKRHLEIRGGPYESQSEADADLHNFSSQNTSMSTFEVMSEADLKWMAKTGVEVHDTMTGRW